MKKRVAEFIGIMLGDGSIGEYNCKVGNKIKRHRVVKISLDSRNKQYINHVRKIMQDVLNIQPKIHYKKKENCVDICTFTKDALIYLIKEIGLKLSPKWGRMKIPEDFMNSKFSCPVLRGLFDTDGCLSVFNNNGTIYPRIEIKMCPSPAQEQVSEILEKLGIKHTIQNLERGKTRVRISGKKELKKWFDLIGSSNKKHVKKANRFLKKKAL
ncbi:hypothetical protein GF378_02850 [Candidatus Pacearchaeota archaeon]|nr:hypothetical protein [Candidatus Pacearchaeota archaeon]